MIEEGTATIKQEAIVALDFSGHVVLGIASSLTTKIRKYDSQVPK